MNLIPANILGVVLIAAGLYIAIKHGIKYFPFPVPEIKDALKEFFYLFTGVIIIIIGIDLLPSAVTPFIICLYIIAIAGKILYKVLNKKNAMKSNPGKRRVQIMIRG